MTLGQSKITLNWSKEPHRGETDSKDEYNCHYSRSDLIVNVSKFHEFNLEVDEEAVRFLDVFEIEQNSGS